MNVATDQHWPLSRSRCLCGAKTTAPHLLLAHIRASLGTVWNEVGGLRQSSTSQDVYTGIPGHELHLGWDDLRTDVMVLDCRGCSMRLIALDSLKGIDILPAKLAAQHLRSVVYEIIGEQVEQVEQVEKQVEK